MPITPYHFGPSVFVGLTLRKWLDIPVFVLANVVVDIEVLFNHHWPMHRYFHTLLIGAVVGAIWGIAAYPLRHFFEKITQMLRIPYQTSLWKMAVSGVLGVWLHVVIDAIYHWDVQIFWPSKAKPLYGLISQGWVKAICVAFFFAALILYTTAVLSYVKQNKARKTIQKNELTPYS
jgi:membrane-bound metal-dependent hydrolase YbcI (DUF457 family)